MGGIKIGGRKVKKREGKGEKERGKMRREGREKEDVHNKRERDPSSEAVQLTLLCCPTSSPGLGTMI